MGVSAAKPRLRTPELLALQSRWCERIGSPLYAELLTRAAEDCESGGPVATLLAPHESEAEWRGSMLALRFMGAVHRVVLEGGAPGLAPFYGSMTPEPDPSDAWPAFRDAVEGGGPRLAELLQRPVQTNEVGRAAGLLGGFLLVAGETGLPLRLLEIGASAGLNLRWDGYRFGSDWGPTASPVRVPLEVVGGTPPLDQGVEVKERRGCDRRPVDAASEEGRLTLLAYTWPDQHERLARLRAALDHAASVPVALAESGAAGWLGQALADAVEGAATIVFQSIVWQYIAAPEQETIRATFEEAGARATVHAPLAWLRMEPGSEQTDVTLTSWPGGHERLLARAGYHGAPVEWLA